MEFIFKPTPTVCMYGCVWLFCRTDFAFIVVTKRVIKEEKTHTYCNICM